MRSFVLLLLVALTMPPIRAADGAQVVHPGDAAPTPYSTLRQIDRTNVARLEPVWSFHTGGAASNTEISCAPLVVDGVLYGTAPRPALLALDAARGLLLWRFDPLNGRRGMAVDAGRKQSLAWWSEGRDRRLLYTANGFLHAVDATTGRLIEAFGAKGRVDLLAAFERGTRDVDRVEASPGAVYRDLLLLPTRLAAAPGSSGSTQICAYEVGTGECRWIFNTIPPADEPDRDGQPPGGAEPDAGLALDRERGLVFIPTGPPSSEFWGGHRAGANLFANCLLALDAATGRRRWHFQFVHHDLWSSGLPAPPVLCTITRDGKKIPAVAQVTQSGHVWVFHRETGEALFPWRERPVPASALVGEIAAPTQPWPERPAAFMRPRFTAAEVTSRTPAAHDAVLARLREMTPHEPFGPPGRRDILHLTGCNGVAPAVDPDGVLYVNGSEKAWVLQMHPQRAEGGVPLGQTLFLQLCSGCHGPDRTGNPALGIPSLVNVGAKLARTGVEDMLHRGRGIMPPFAFLTEAQQIALIDSVRGQPAAAAGSGSAMPGSAGGTDSRGPPYTTGGFYPFLDPDGFPALRPPWGTLNALDLNTGEYRWQRPLGETPGLPGAGAENRGGPLVTAGGVVFIAATKDEKMRAFDTATGRLLWESALPAGGYVTPVTYSVAGRQFVVIACGGNRMGTKPGSAYVAFALPEK